MPLIPIAAISIFSTSFHDVSLLSWTTVFSSRIWVVSENCWLVASLP